MSDRDTGELVLGMYPSLLVFVSSGVVSPPWLNTDLQEFPRTFPSA